MVERIGFALSSLTGLPPSELARLAGVAERRGFDTLALTESYNDVMPLATAVAGATRSARVATAIANVGFRHPALMAMGAAAVDELSGGRFVLGLGIGTQWFDRAALGEADRRPLGALAEYVGLLRRLWAAGTDECHADGEFYRLDRFHLDSRPLRPDIPIYLAALGPAMLRLAGRLADGVFLNLVPPETLPEMLDRIHEAAVEAGRAPEAVTVAMMIRACPDDDVDRARDAIRASFPHYLRFPGYVRHLTALGYGTAVDEAHAALDRGELAAAVSAVPDELIDRTALYGPPERCRAGLERFRASGLDLPIISARALGEDWTPTLERAISAFAPNPRGILDEPANRW